MISSAGRVKSPAETKRHPDFVPGLLVVKVKPDVVADAPDVHRATAAAIRGFHFPSAIESPFSQLRRSRVIQGVVPVFARQESRRVWATAGRPAVVAFTRSVRDTESAELQGINLLRLSASADLAKVEKQMKGTPGMEYVHRVPARWLAGPPAVVSPDPRLNRQWGLRAIEWFEASPLPDAAAIKVAVLDTGVDSTHPDLKDVVAGYEYDGAAATDIIGHGTHVCGIIAARSDNALGLSGICRCSLHVWKIFGDNPASDGEYYVDELMYQRALDAARAAGMQVMNLSIGGTQRSQTEEMLFRRLVSSGCTVVAAMGNDYQQGNPTEYPAAYPGVVAVGAVDEANRRAPFSNTGDHMALSAPGANILSTLPLKTSAARKGEDTEYAAWSGTSMATPHVTAAAALVLARNPGSTAEQVAERLKSAAKKVRDMKGRSRTGEFGAGLLNLRAALS